MTQQFITSDVEPLIDENGFAVATILDITPEINKEGVNRTTGEAFKNSQIKVSISCKSLEGETMSIYLWLPIKVSRQRRNDLVIFLLRTGVINEDDLKNQSAYKATLTRLENIQAALLELVAEDIRFKPILKPTSRGDLWGPDVSTIELIQEK